jgi:hypothetical protein
MDARPFVISFRIAASAQAIAMFAQTVLAGMALSGSAMALTAHMFNGAATVLASAMQAGFAVLLWRSRQFPRGLLIASVALLAGQLSQIVSGRFHVFALHLPLGVGLFGVLTVLVFWAWSSQLERAATSSSIEHRGGSYA